MNNRPPQQKWTNQDEWEWSQLGHQDAEAKYTGTTFDRNAARIEGVDANELSDEDFDREYEILGTPNSNLERRAYEAAQRAKIADSGRLLHAEEQDQARPVQSAHQPRTVQRAEPISRRTGTNADLWLDESRRRPPFRNNERA